MKLSLKKISGFFAGLILLIPGAAFAATGFKSMFCTGGTCNTYEDWINGVWNWSLAIIVPLSVLVIAAAGVIYTTSAGNPDKIGMAKKMIIGVISGIAILILARLLLVNVIGVSPAWNIK